MERDNDCGVDFINVIFRDHDCRDYSNECLEGFWIMGTWKVSVKELVEVMAKALDDVEGDFSDKDLKESLKKMREYPYTSNCEKNNKDWEDYLGGEE